MFLWLRDNAATLTVCLILAVLTALVIRKIIRDRKKGCSGCSGCSGCGSCALREGCCRQEKQKSRDSGKSDGA